MLHEQWLDAALYAETDRSIAESCKHRRRTGGATSSPGHGHLCSRLDLLVEQHTRHDPTWWLLRHSAPQGSVLSTSPQPDTREVALLEVKVLRTVVCSLVLPDNAASSSALPDVQTLTVDPDAGLQTALQRPKTRRRVTFSDQQGLEPWH
jgi:hypothetical protein